MIEAYDRLAKVWAESTDDNLWNEHLERRAVRALLPDDLRGRSVLDAGCAAGAHAAWLLDRGSDVTGIDLSAAMVAAATERCGGRGRFLRADLSRPLPFADDTFDGVLCSLALHYVRDIRPPLAELARVLRSSGWLVLSLDHPAGSLHLDAPTLYFETRQVSEVWVKSGVEVRQTFWRRPLGAVFDALVDAGFLIERIGEPRVDDQGLQQFGEEAAEVSGVPTFIVYRAMLGDGAGHASGARLGRMSREGETS